MNYISTRNDKLNLKDTFCIMNGLSNDKGLFVPTSIPKIYSYFCDSFHYDQKLSFNFLSQNILSLYFDSINKNDLENFIDTSYKQFSNIDITPTTKIGDDFLLELYHGPTCAFKDIALTVLPHLLVCSQKKENSNNKIYILCATSGDTGKAALSGFSNVDNTFITVFYPYKQISNMQYLQMVSTPAKNTNVVSVNGNFDTCQRIVKNLMNKKNEFASHKNIIFSSANSINIGRLIPQIVYYFKSYFDLVFSHNISLNDKVNFIVPTGNFGDILAGYLAKNMGLPIDKLVCATNKNNVLTDFFNTGIYDANRPFYNTLSPSMDILISSNLERLLYFYSKDVSFINDIENSLYKNKKFEISKEMLSNINDTFLSYSCSDENIMKTIYDTFYNKNRIIDPHTACSTYANAMFKKEYNPTSKSIILSTASIYKFTNTVLKSLNVDITDDDFKNMDLLYDKAKEDIPKSLLDLKNATTYHSDNINENDANDYIKNKINVLSREN